MGSKRDLTEVYRPEIWDDVKGQTPTVNMLKNQISTMKDGMSGAYLFAGPTGVGKTTIARLFFKTLNCKSITPTGDPCGECSPCKYPQHHLREVHCGDDRGIEDMRKCREAMMTMPWFGGVYRGMLLDEVHKLRPDAQSILLKYLEGVSDHAVWILVTTEPEKILETVRDRCQRFDLVGISDDEIVNRIGEIVQKEEIEISRADLVRIAEHSKKGLRKAIRLLEKYRAADNRLDLRNYEDLKQDDKINDKKKTSKVTLSGIQPEIIKALKEMAPQVKRRKLLLKDIVAKLNMPENKGKDVADELRQLGFVVKPSRGLSCLFWDEPKITKLFK